MSNIAEFPNFDKLSTIPFTPDEIDGLTVVREERMSLPIELKALIDPSIFLPDIDMHKIEQDEIQAIKNSTSEGSEGDELVVATQSSSASNVIPDNQLTVNAANDSEDPMEVESTVNRLYLTDEGLAAFASGSFEQIDALEKQAQKDWKPIADMVQNVGFDCFIKVEYEGEGEMYVANIPEAKDGSMWVIAQPPNVPGMDPGSSKKISVNMYSASSGFLSVSSSVWSKVPGWLLPHLVAAVVGSLTGYALRRGAAAFGVRVFENLVRRLGIRWAARAGVFARGVVKVGGGLLSAVAIEAAFWVAWRRYAFTVSVFVFDTQNNWKATHVQLDNAEFPAGHHFAAKDLGRCTSPGKIIDLVGLRPKKQIHAGPSIHYYNFGNKSEIFQGLGAGMRFERGDGAQSAAAKFIVPRWTACKIKIEGNISSDSLGAFYESDNWISDKPKERFTATTAGGTELTAMWNEVKDDEKSNPGLQREYKAKFFLGKPTDFGLEHEKD